MAHLLCLPDEIVEALAVTSEDGVPRYDPDERYPEPQDILTRCSSLVTTSDSTYPSLWEKDDGQGPSTDTVTLVLSHFSVKEYLLSERIRNRATSRFHFTEKSANTLIAQTCLAYLQQFDSMNWPTAHKLRLSAYAARNWDVHALVVGEASSDALRPLIMKLFHLPGYQYINWILLHVADYCHGDISCEPWPIISPLYSASRMGLMETTSLLLDEGADINEQTGPFDSALSAAAAGGHQAVVQMLLDRGADVNMSLRFSGSALQIAVKQGHLSVVQLPLDNGADVNAQGGCYGNALNAASHKHNQKAVQLLLDNGADPSTLVAAERHFKTYCGRPNQGDGNALCAGQNRGGPSSAA